MKQNVGTLDRLICYAVAAVLIVVGLGIVRGPAGIVIAAVGLIPLLTALIGFCPLYVPFGINTCRRKDA
jgi:hypothetical protein